MDAPVVSPAEIRRLVGEGSYQRGRAYAAAGMVRRHAWDEEDRLLTGIVDGSGSQRYWSQVSFAASGAIRASECSCPMAFDCKHIAAVLLVAAAPEAIHVAEPAPAARVPRRATPAAASWRALVPDGDGDAPSLALGVELRRRRRTAARWASAKAEPMTWSPRALSAEQLHVGVRPLIRSATTQRWIKGDISWESVRFQRPGPNPEHLRWMRELQALAAASRAPWSSIDSAEWIVLDAIESPLLWPHLREGARLGIPLVSFAKSATVRLAPSASVRVLVDDASDAAGSGALRVSVAAEIDGREVAGPTSPVMGSDIEGVRPVGSTGVYGFAVTRRGVALTLAEVALPPAVRMLLAGDPVTVPAGERREFFDRALGPLTRRVAVTTATGVELPKVTPPHLRVEARFAPGDLVDYSLQWIYPDGGPYGYATDDGAAIRDGAVETAARGAIERAWAEASSLPFAASARFSGADTAVFSAQTLPALDSLDGVRVVITGDRPDYRALEGVPEITVSTVETTDADWFELGVLVVVAGRTIPFAPLFTALALRQKRLLLSDGAYFSLGHPALDRLRDLIAEAADLPEWETGPRISRYQSALWSEFEDIADHALPAAAWREHAEGLRDVEAIPDVPVPEGLRAELRPYQHAGFTWLAFLWSHRLGGILADDMGLGKTMQMLALITHATSLNRTSTDHRPFLVVAPTSVLTTWRAEAARFAPDLDVRVIEATAARRGSDLTSAVAGGDLVITSYTLLRLEAAEFAALTWEGVILDEAQFVKNPATKLHRAVRDLDARVVFAVTGTPMENSLTDLWAILGLTSPGLFPSAARFRQEYTAPIEQAKAPNLMELSEADAAVAADEFRRGRLDRLRRRIRPLVLRRTKEDVAPELPPKQEQLLRVDLGPAHRAHYDRVLQRERQKVLGLLADFDRNRFIVFRSLTLLRMLSLAPSLVDPTLSGMGSAKLDALLERVEEAAAEGHRSLVFSQFTSFLALAAERLDAAGIRYAYLDGSTRRRAEVIESFRAGETPVFLISLKAGGFGLTLTEADYVFLLDPWWNPAAEAQAVDRTHRIGQNRTVMVYRMIATGTIEEKVLALQERKAKLFQAVVDDEALFGQTLGADDIRGILEG